MTATSTTGSAARSVFNLFSFDEETFVHAQMWKNLLSRTCIVQLWERERAGRSIEVWGNVPTGTGAEAK